jgi:signal transduction histidine kinase
MGIVNEFFTTHLPEIFFIYGLAFFLTGVAVMLELTRSPELPVARTLPFLGLFGLIHGTHEWLEMFQLIAARSPGPAWHGFRVLVLGASFVLLVEFGIRVLCLGSERQRWALIGRLCVFGVFLAGLVVIARRWNAVDGWAAADAWSRYVLAVPGALLAAAGLHRQRQRLQHSQPAIARDLLIAGVAFALYGIPGQLVGERPLLPPDMWSSGAFLRLVGLPIQLWRAAAASVVAIFTIRALRLFELARVRAVAVLNRDRMETQRQLYEEMTELNHLRRQLYQQAVRAQEEERHRIARELHDQAGQSLTALSFGLAALRDTLPEANGAKPSERVEELQRLTERVMDELQQLTSRLRPAALDELGLVPALVSYADRCSARFALVVDVEISGHQRRLSPEAETALYRIAQEGVTNVVKHAHAHRVVITLEFTPQAVDLSVWDDGVGMDVETACQAAVHGKGWGLAGIRERAQLLGGSLEIQAALGAGSCLRVHIPMEEVEST